MSQEDSFDMYDIQFIMLENAHRSQIAKKNRLERNIAQLKEELEMQLIDINKTEKLLGALKTKVRVKF